MDPMQLLKQYKDRAPEWANFITADSHGYVKAWENEPKQTPGGLFYAVGRECVVSSPGFAPVVMDLRGNAQASC